METNAVDMTNAVVNMTMDGGAVMGPGGGELAMLFAAYGIIIAAVYGVLMLVGIISGWKILSKAGLPGWGILIPVWNSMLLWQAAGKPGWWGIIALIVSPLWIAHPFMLAGQFGKGGGYGVGLLLLPIIFYPMLAFGSAEHASQVEEGESGKKRKKGKSKKEKKAKKGKKEAPKGLVLWVIFSILIVGALIAVLVLQYQEFVYYQGDDPASPQTIWPVDGRYADPF